MITDEILDREPTPEEIAEMRERMEAYYDNQIPFLTKQKEYETLLSEIEIARARRVEASIRIAQMTMGPQDEQQEPEPVAEEPKKRTLKKDK